MLARRGPWLSILLLVTACRAEFTNPPPPAETEGSLPRCTEVGMPLAITPSAASVGAGQLFVLSARGGTGAYRWSFAANASGGSVDPRAGVYLAGDPAGTEEPTVDVVLLEDEGCQGEASASLTVVEAPRIVPSRLALEPGESVQLRAEPEDPDNPDRYTFTLSTMVSGTITEGGLYTAGGALGTDVVRMHDALLDAQAEAIIEVVADASIRLSPAQWVIPVGGTAALPVAGGSGAYDVALTGGFEHVDGTTIRATAAGAGTVTFTDAFTGREGSAQLLGVSPHEPPRRLATDRQETHLVRTGDVDGDGDLDAVVGMESHTVDWFEGGAVLIYLNDGAGLGTEPARVISGAGRSEELGMDVELADLDADGRLDLIVGARRASLTRNNVGAVFVYGGLEEGLDSEGRPFTAEPVRTFLGQGSFDLFGDSVEVCDFNGDGRLDLAVSAPYGQHPDGERDQGTVQVFLAYPEGRFISAPDVELFGGVEIDPDDDSLIGIAGMRLGEDLASGDFDGDGVCDLAAYAVQASESQRDTGAVFLYRGRAADGPDRGGPEERPRLIWGVPGDVDDNARFGEDVLLGDLNGDDRDDLVATRYLHDGADGGDTGAVYVRFGGAMGEQTTTITAVDAGASWSVEGLGSDRVGNAAALFDVDGDGTLDLISGDSRAEVPDGELDRPGMIRVYRGGDLSTTPTWEYEGPVAGARFGLGVGAIGDLDGDGRSELLAFAPYHDAVDGENDDRGALWLQPGAGGPPTEMTVPRVPTGQLAGRSVAWLGDLNGDGFDELAVAAPRADIVGVGRDVGAVYLHRGTADGVDPTPAQELSGFAGHSEGDELAWQVLSAGDFDGDGAPDLAVLARSEDLPETLDAMVYEPVGACARRDNPGVLLVFRGRGDGTVEPEPMLAYYGPFANQRFEYAIGRLDVNGDGLDDLVVGGREWDFGEATNAGGVAVVHGRAPAADGRILAVCDPDVRVDEAEGGARLGAALTSMGDLDADGCDDFAAGAPEADPGGDANRNAGRVEVFFGYAAADPLRCGADTTFRRATLVGTDRDAQGGLALAGGVDLGGDGVPDLLVGAPRFRDGRGEVGRVIWVDGARIRGAIGATVPFIDAASTSEIVVDGVTAGEQLGHAIAVAPRAGGGFVVLGGPFGASSGVVNTGGAVVYQTGATGFASAPSVQIAGESLGLGQLGDSLDVRVVGGRLRVAVGALWSSAGSVDDGASYAFSLTP